MYLIFRKTYLTVEHGSVVKHVSAFVALFRKKEKESALKRKKSAESNLKIYIRNFELTKKQFLRKYTSTCRSERKNGDKYFTQ